jgi:hypothetical protein
MSTRKTVDKGVEVSLICTGSECNNVVHLCGSSPSVRVYQFNPTSKHICMSCGKDMKLNVAKLTSIEVTETV